MTFTKFEDIRMWQDARSLFNTVRTITLREHAKHDYNWKDQILRSSSSVMANIAEGFESGSDKQFANFCMYARRSASEVRSHLYYGFDCEYMTKEEFDALANLTKKISAGLLALIRYLSETNRKQRGVLNK